MVSKKKSNPKNLIQYIPETIKIGIYTYSVEIRALKDDEGECNFRDKKILLSDHLCYDLDEPNWELTIEVLLHEIHHAYNLNVGIHSGFFDFKKKSVEDVEEIFVDFQARHLVMMIKDNPEMIKLLSLLTK